jgi:hypothetical protein
VSQPTINKILRRGILVLRCRLVPRQISFPQGEQLVATMTAMQNVRGLPYCMGAIDGTFFKIKKPSGAWSDAYYCYKRYPAIILLAICDADQVFTFVEAGTSHASCGHAGTITCAKSRRAPSV